MEKAKQLKRDDSTPLYIQLRDMVKDDILNEKLLPGDKLPDLKSLCQIYNIGLVTARQAITELVNEGLVYRRPWHGTFVNINVKDTPAFRNRLKTVAFVAPNIMDLMITGTVYGLERNCRDKGYHLLFCNSENNYSMERERIEDLIEKKVDGVVIWLADEDGQGNLNENYIRSIALEKIIPFVLIDKYLPRVNTDYVVSDNYHGAYTAVRHFVSLGYTSIIHLTRPTIRNCTSAKERLEGYKQALIDSGLAYNPENVFIDGESDWPREIIGLADSHKGPIACFVAMEFLAVRLMKIVADRGLSVPKDIGIIGFDNSILATDLSVPLTTIEQPWNAMGKTAVEILIDNINNRAVSLKQIRLQSRLIIRESCGAKLKTEK